MTRGMILGSASVVMVLVGVWIVCRGSRHRTTSPTRQSLGHVSRQLAFSRRDRVLAVLGLVSGVIAFAFSGWPVMLAVLPVVVIGAPRLVVPPRSQLIIGRLEGLEEWTRVLAGVLAVGIGLEQAIIRTQRSTPKVILPQVDALVGRLRSRWSTESALRQFADDLADPTGDLICAALISSSERRGPGLRDILESLAESVSEDVRARRQIEADRAKPRATARWVTILTLSALALLFVFNGEYLAPYSSPAGQVALAALVGAYIGALLWMRQIAEGTPIPRFLDSAV
jgi:tight adherence protein B